MKVLLTSFDPFGAEPQNSSLELLRLLPDRLEDISLVKEVLPTQFVEAPRRLQELLNDVEPDLLLLLGQAGGRKQVHFERVAINCMSARIPDNAGRSAGTSDSARWACRLFYEHSVSATGAPPSGSVAARGYLQYGWHLRLQLPVLSRDASACGRAFLLSVRLRSYPLSHGTILPSRGHAYPLPRVLSLHLKASYFISRQMKHIV